MTSTSKPRWCCGPTLAAAFALAYCVCLQAIAGDTASRADADTGMRIYREGILPSDQPVRATVQGDVTVAGTQLACASCHRRSGLGSSEGGRVIPAVAGSNLYQPWERKHKELYQRRAPGPGTRPAYTDESLGRAIRDGIDPTGRPLDPLMPRYALNDTDLAALVSYLKSLSSRPAPGVTESTMHFATVVTDGVDPSARKAMLAVLGAYLRVKNAGTRHETRRARHSPFQRAWHYKAHRQWVLHTWQLQGAQAAWPKQLEDYYATRPVFALVGGIGSGSWRPVHEFCEHFEIPCLFPTTDLPAIAETDFYSVYFSKGVTLEAEVLAKHLSGDWDDAQPRNIVQVFRNEEISSVPAAAFRAALQRYGINTLRDRRMASDETATPRFWREVLSDESPHILVLWLGEPDVATLATQNSSGALPERIYLSSTLAGQYPGVAPDGLQAGTYVVHPFDHPNTSQQRLLRTNAWLRSQRIEPTHPRIQANTFFVATLLGKLVKHIGGNFSREYLLERLEHVVDNSLVTSVYPRLSLAPGQRFASKGSYVVELPAGAEKRRTPASGWIIP